MSRFFPPALTVERKGEIIVFKQGEDESLYTAWELRNHENFSYGGRAQQGPRLGQNYQQTYA